MAPDLIDLYFSQQEDAFRWERFLRVMNHIFQIPKDHELSQIEIKQYSQDQKLWQRRDYNLYNYRIRIQTAEDLKEFCLGYFKEFDHTLLSFFNLKTSVEGIREQLEEGNTCIEVDFDLIIGFEEMNEMLTFFQEEVLEELSSLLKKHFPKLEIEFKKLKIQYEEFDYYDPEDDGIYPPIHQATFIFNLI